MSPPITVGVIGCGEVAQVIHIPTLSHLSDLFKITYLCDISPKTVAHAATKVLPCPTRPVQTTQSAETLCSSPTVEVVFVLGSDEYHAEHVLLALRHDKHVFVEKPMTLTRRDAEAIVIAEKASAGRVMVGYMRRYAPVLQDAIAEIGGMDKITYARVRDIIGPNSKFVAQSGTFPKSFTDHPAADVADKERRAEEMVREALEGVGVPYTQGSARMWRCLASLGSHDLSLMREILGMPISTLGSSLAHPIWNVLFEYPTFTVCYESGFHSVPIFDSHIEVYSADKSVLVQYDTPYIKGLPVTMRVRENSPDGKFVERLVRNTYQDPYTLELEALWKAVKFGASVKTTAEDSLRDIEVFEMIMRQWRE